jgi:WD40 repeat protein
VIIVHIGNGEAVTVTTESGTFTAAGNFTYSDPAHVNVTLLPNTIHHLDIVAKVRAIECSDECICGDYTLHTRAIIVQGQPSPPRVAGAVIGQKNASQLERLGVILSDRGLREFIFADSNEIIGVGDDHVTRWNVTTGLKISRIGDDVSGLRIDISSDQSLIAAVGADADRSIYLWDVSTGSQKTLGHHGYGSLVESVAFNPGGSLLAIGDHGNRVNVWDIDGGAHIVTLEGDVPGRHQTFFSLFWTDDRTLVAAGSEAIYWWNVNTGDLLERLACPKDAAFVVDVAFAQNGSRLAGVAQSDTIYFWDRDVAEWVVWPARPGSSMWKVEFSPDGRLLASITHEGEILLWNVDTQELLVSRSLTYRSIGPIQFSPDGRYLAVLKWESTVELWGVP